MSVPPTVPAASATPPPAAAWLALTGPTASGKTAAALAIAQRWPVEIISVDSALVYRGMDIGTAKPSPAERAAVPHHLIDIRDPLQAYSAAEFVRDARRLVAEIRARGRWPLLVGGTLLYFKALFDGLDELPPAQPALRAAIEAEARARGWPALHAELARVDPLTAARLPPTDAQRIGRALEVWRATGQPLSALQRRWAPDAPAQRGALCIDGLPGRLLSLEPRERAWLYRRIDERFAAMLAGGLLHEVQHLRARGDLHLGLPSMRCVGYRQAWEALDAAAAHGRDALDASERAALLARGAAATRQLAKRQLTWLRAIPQREVIWIDTLHDPLPAVLDIVCSAWGGPGSAPPPVPVATA
ncbi:tRNA (adenosine(37)-N6)-dimethylallyltransferase MiaA [Tepidimonas charontis]|uniref:tRNA dimethylallyltransferase n=1 Tax=Tepidimonas charontis TaxID=2267262 RepID=A0A554X7G1_9BURK|nr:tRNA (adenosine(37)-N6)-dimethylallyltransferase MiaA [Tepidimonas charontis]TSE31760.1 tRNA dimethylallyltransferase [Tepidimonas charontis]